MCRMLRRPSVHLLITYLSVIAGVVLTTTMTQAQGPALNVSVGTGWNGISLPYEPVNGDPYELFDELRPPTQTFDLLSGSLHRYDQDAWTYVTYQHLTPTLFGPAVHGKGYWLWASAATVIGYGCVVPSSVPRTTLNGAGWHMLGLPRLGSFPLSDVLVTNTGTGESKLFADALAVRWVQRPLYRIDRAGAEGNGVTYTCVPAFGQPLTDAALSAYAAYWVYQPADGIMLTFDRPPADLAAEATKPTEVRLTWIDTTTYETGYQVERRLPSTEFELIAALPMNATVYVDANAAPETTYEYRVRGLNAVGFTSYTDAVTVTTPPDDGTISLGYVTAVAADINRPGYAYGASRELGLIVFDVTVAASPEAISAVAAPTTRVPLALSVSQNVVAMAAADAVSLYDVSDPAAPVRVATIAVPAQDVTLIDSYLYVCDAYNDLLTFDISDPSEPIMQSTAVPVRGYELDVAGGSLWVAALSELRGVAMQPPWSPSLAGSVPTAGCQVVCGSLEHAYVFSDAALRVIDVADPLDPFQVGSLNIGGGSLSALSPLNEHVYATLSSSPPLVSYALYAYDVSDPNQPFSAGFVQTRGVSSSVSAIEISAQDRRCYVADGSAGFTVIDVSDPTHPQVVGGCSTM